MAQGGSRGIAPLIFNLGAEWCWVFNAVPLAAFSPVEGTGTVVQDKEWIWGPFWTGVEKSHLQRASNTELSDYADSARKLRRLETLMQRKIFGPMNVESK